MDRSPHHLVTVFAVDDHPAFLATVGLVVGAAPGFELVGTATSGREALTTLADRDTPVDLILADVVMPGITGPEFARRYRAAGGRAPVILMSSYESDDLPTMIVGSPGSDPAPFLAKTDLSPEALATMWNRVAANESPSGR